METIIVILACLVAVAAFVAYCTRKDRRASQHHQAMMLALAPGPRVREMTYSRSPYRSLETTSPRSFYRRSRLGAGSQQAFVPVAPDEFQHIATDYGTHTPASIDSMMTSPMHAPCAEASSYDTCSSPAHAPCAEASSYDACASSCDTSSSDSSGGSCGD